MPKNQFPIGHPHEEMIMEPGHGATGRVSVRQAPLRGQVSSLAAREFALQQAPFIAASTGAGISLRLSPAWFLPGGDQAYPLAQVRVPV